MSRFECNQCSRRDKCKGPLVPAAWPDFETCEVLVISESPDENDETDEQQMTGPRGTAVIPILQQIASSYVITNCVCCYAPGKPTDKQIAACKPYWQALALQLRPRVIVTLGSYAAKAVSGRAVKITADVGQTSTLSLLYPEDWPNRALHETVLNVPVVFNFHPTYLLHMQEERGGASEKVEHQFFECWEQVSKLLHDGMDELPDVMCATDYETVRKLLNHLLNTNQRHIAYDYETAGDRTALRPELCNEFSILSVGVALYLQDQPCAFSFPLDKPGVWKPKQKLEIERLWRYVLNRYDGRAIAQNAKYEHKCNLKRFGFTRMLGDTMLRMNHVDERAAAKLDAIARWSGITWAHYKGDMEGVQKDPASYPLDKLLRYNALDALATLISYEKLTETLQAEDTENSARCAEWYARWLAQLEMDGMHVDMREGARVKRELTEELQRATASFRSHKAVQKAEAWAAETIKSAKKRPEFNPSSPKQMSYLCNELLKLRVQPDRFGKVKLDKRVLAKYEEKHPVIRDLNRVRSIAAMFSGFLNKWEESIGPQGCVHTQYVQTDVMTGRLASRDPNLQNIPRDSKIKRIFRSRYDDGWLINGDFNQLEPRLLAGWSQDPKLITAFRENLDLHLFVTAAIYRLDFEELRERYKAGDEEASRLRDYGKRMNLGNLYGQTAFGLSEKTDLTQDEAEEMIARYNSEFAGVLALRTAFQKQAMHYGYVTDLFKRKRHLPAAQSDNTYKRNRALRQAGNAPIQSTGNQFCLMSVSLCAGKLQDVLKGDARVIATTHDSITVDTRESCIDEALEIMKQAMDFHNHQPYWSDKGVEISAAFKVGKNLLDLTSV